MKKITYIFLLFSVFSFGQHEMMLLASQAQFANEGGGQGTIYFANNAATPTPYEVDGLAGVADASTNYTITSDTDSNEGTYAIKAQLNNDITATQGLTIDLINLVGNTSYDISCDCKVSAGAGNARMQLRSDADWGSNQSSGFFGTTYSTITLTETIGAGITTSSIRFIFTSSGDLNDSMFIDNCTVTPN